MPDSPRPAPGQAALAWASYLRPETIHQGPHGEIAGVLRNKLDATTTAELDALEYAAAKDRAHELRSQPGLVAATADPAELRAIHAWLFQDIYDWAGQYRIVELGKDGRVFASPYDGSIERSLAQACQIAATTSWLDLDHHDLATACAEVFAHLNYAHPFREGNGRATKLFMESLTRDATHTLSWAHVTAADWNQASKDAMPATDGAVSPHPLVSAFKQALQSPTNHPHPPHDHITRIIRLMQPGSAAGPTPHDGLHSLHHPPHHGHGPTL